MQMHRNPSRKRAISISSDSDGELGVEVFDTGYSHQNAQV